VQIRFKNIGITELNDIKTVSTSILHVECTTKTITFFPVIMKFAELFCWSLSQ